MPHSSRFNEIRLGFGHQVAERPKANQPFRILLMGDFSGRASRGIVQTGDLATRKAVMIDRDNFDDRLQQMNVTVRAVVAGDQATDLTFTELDDFGPDRLFDKLELFASLRKLRRRLANNDTFAAAAEEVKKWHGVASQAPEEPAESKPADNQLADMGADLLSAALEATPQTTSRSLVSAADWDALVQRIVEPYVLPGKDPRQDEFLAIVDNAISDQMRALMHRAEVQRIEAAWRGVYFLTRHLETDSSLKIYLLDVSQEELRADLVGSSTPAGAGIYKNLVEQTVGTTGAEPWALLVGDYRFSATEPHAQLVARLAVLAAAAGAPLISGADYTHVSAKPIGGLGDPDDWAPPADAAADAWQELRSLPESSYACLTFPGVMLRLPFGRKGRPAEQFAFEETTSPPESRQFLWSNGAYLVAMHLAESFLKAGWDMQPPPVRQVGNLPVFIYDDGSDSAVYPCAEAFLVDRAADRIRMQGLTPIRSMKNVDAIQIAGMRALSIESADLNGRWRS